MYAMARSAILTLRRGGVRWRDTFYPLAMLREGAVTSRDGTRVSLAADTVCIHGDAPGAVGFARALRAALAESGFEARAPAAGVTA
jgi:hypothetical protein